MDKKWMWEPRTEVGEAYNQITVIDNTIVYKNRVRYILVKCSCGKEYQTREYEFVNRVGSGYCRACVMSMAGKKRRLPDDESAKNECRNDYMQGAKSRGLIFELSKEQFNKLILDNCFYCGEKPSRRQSSRTSVILVNGVDRFDNSIGYTQSNCVTACWTCNSAKRAMDGNDFILWASRIASNNKGWAFKR